MAVTRLMTAFVEIAWSMRTTFPVQTFLGWLTREPDLLAPAGGLAFAIIAGLVWLKTLRAYASAGSWTGP